MTTAETQAHIDRIVAAAPPLNAGQQSLIRKVFVDDYKPMTDVDASADDLDALREVIDGE